MPLATTISPSELCRVTSAAPVATVQAIDLVKQIDDRPIFSGLTFEIPTGSITALLGPNGAGKSTLLRVIGTLLPASGGELSLFGQRVGRDAVALRSRIGMIAHGAMLYRELSARENLVFFGRLYALRDAADRAAELLARVGLLRRADDPVKTFSRGMLQRVSIARALMHDPDLLLADEPFTGLDAPSRQVLEQMLIDLRDQGKSIILANHDVPQSLLLADRAIVLRPDHPAVFAAAHSIDIEANFTWSAES